MLHHLSPPATLMSGQDQAAVIKRQLLRLLPAAKVFLDVDDLVEIGDLENCAGSPFAPGSCPLAHQRT